MFQNVHMWITYWYHVHYCAVLVCVFRVMCGYVWNWWTCHWTSFIVFLTAKTGEFLRMFWGRLLSMYVVIDVYCYFCCYAVSRQSDIRQDEQCCELHTDLLFENVTSHYDACALLSCVCVFNLPSVLWHCWLGVRKGIRPVKIWLLRCWHGYLLEQSANSLHMVQLMPLPPHHVCFSKIQNGLSFWYRLTWVVPDNG